MRTLKNTISAFIDDDCLTQGAALAYYALFSLPPLLLVIISIAGLIMGEQAVQAKIQAEIQTLVGGTAGRQVGTMIQDVGQQHSSATTLGAIFGFIALAFGATSAFVQLQTGLNTVWHVKPDPAAGGVKTFLVQRVLSFIMIIGIGLLLLVSLALSTVLQAAGGVITSSLGQGVSQPILQAGSFVVSFAVITLLFAAIYKGVPDVRLKWKYVWVGALVTALLFTIGKFLIGIYLGKSGGASYYGAAGSLVLIVLWIYYSSLILFLGAEFTKAYSTRGHPVIPKDNAVSTDPPPVPAAPAPAPQSNGNPQPVVHPS